jgi:hypothetical protein
MARSTVKSDNLSLLTTGTFKLPTSGKPHG